MFRRQRDEGDHQGVEEDHVRVGPDPRLQLPPGLADEPLLILPKILPKGHPLSGGREGYLPGWRVKPERLVGRREI